MEATVNATTNITLTHPNKIARWLILSVLEDVERNFDAFAGVGITNYAEFTRVDKFKLKNEVHKLCSQLYTKLHKEEFNEENS